jgi:hypothetical protein
VLIKVESGAGDVDRDGDENNVCADLISPNGTALRPVETVMSNVISLSANMFGGTVNLYSISVGP